MTSLIRFLFSLLSSTLRTGAPLQLQVAALRHQLFVYQGTGQRPRIAPADRLLWSQIATLWSGWRSSLCFVKPRTVVAWQQKRFRDYWRRLSQSGRRGRPTISPELRNLIRRMWEANPCWGSPRIVGELGTLGIHVAKSTVEKYKPQRDTPRSPILGHGRVQRAMHNIHQTRPSCRASHGTRTTLLLPSGGCMNIRHRQGHLCVDRWISFWPNESICLQEFLAPTEQFR